MITNLKSVSVIVIYSERSSSIAQYYISLLSGIWNDDHYGNPNINNRDHLVGQLTTGVVARYAIETTKSVVLLLAMANITSCTLLTSSFVILTLQTLVFSILVQYLHVLMKSSVCSWKKYETDLSHSFKWNIKPIWVALFKCSQLTAALLEIVDYLGHKSWRQIVFKRSGTTYSSVSLPFRKSSLQKNKRCGAG